MSNWSFKFSVLVGSEVFELCRKAYAAFMDISDKGLQRLINGVKLGACMAPGKIDDVAHVEVECSPDELKKFAELFGVKLSDRQLGAVKIPPRSTKSKAAVQWLDSFITVAACVNPKDNKLQIELCGMDELYLMYVNDFTNVFKEKYLGKNHFRKIFKDVFSPVVQIRKRKSVTGKCQICALLSFIRSRAKSQVEIEAISKLHMIHKIGFMGERNSYYERRALAMRLPMEYLSLITDGMAQIHCLLPWMKGKAQPSNVNLKQHLQGTFVHGKGIYIYRTFNNVKVHSFFFFF